MTYQGDGSIYRDGQRLTSLVYSLDERMGVLSGIIVVDDEGQFDWRGTTENLVLQLTTHKLQLHVTIEHESLNIYSITAAGSLEPLTL